MLLHEILSAAARDHADETALICPADEVRLTFGQLSAASTALAAAVDARVSPGGRVAIIAHNRAEYVVACYGVPQAGRVLVPLNPRLHAKEWAEQLRRSGTELVLAERAFADLLAAEWAGPVVVLGEDGTWDGILAEGRSLRAPAPPASDRDLAWLLFTSGSTGRPTGVRLTHRSLTAAMRTTLARRPVHDDTVFLTPFPLCHIAAAYQIPMHHVRARPVVVARKYDPEQFLAAVRAHCVTSTSLAPTMIDALLDRPDAADLRGVLRSIGYGASPITPDLLRRTADILGCALGQGYGSTELSGNAVFLTPEDHRPELLSAAGRPGPGVELRIVDDAWADVPDGALGEIAVQAEQVCDGYWDDPEATAAAIQGGWFRTGDLGRLDADGYLYIVDRKKDIVITGGENVSAREVEAVLRTHPAIRDVAVIGQPDARWGETVCAVVVATTDPTTNAPLHDPREVQAELVSLCRSHLAGFKVPRTVHFVAELPTTASGKVSKPALREQFATQHAGN
ncbi:MAG: AMP-binding protein [Streptomycetaceae bacterium]|nr:AMP-binding protein [Streptomycetaceae bacterium]